MDIGRKLKKMAMDDSISASVREQQRGHRMIGSGQDVKGNSRMSPKEVAGAPGTNKRRKRARVRRVKAS